MAQETILWSPLSIDECIRRLTQKTKELEQIRTFRVDRCRLELTEIDEHSFTLYPALRTRLHYGTRFRGTFEPQAGGTLIRGEYSAHPLVKIPPLLICGAGTVASCVLVGFLIPIMSGVLLIIGNDLAQSDPDGYAVLVSSLACMWMLPLSWVVMGALFALISYAQRPAYRQRISRFIEGTLDARTVDDWKADATA
jgi:hypothetical protein